MLKTIIEHNHIRSKFLMCQHTGRKSVFTDNNRYLAKTAGNHIRFITGQLRSHLNRVAVTDNTALTFSAAPVSPADYRYFKSQLLKLLRQIHRHRRLTRAAQCNIANTNYPAGQLVRGHDFSPIAKLSEF